MGGDLPRVPGDRITTTGTVGYRLLKNAPGGRLPGADADVVTDDGDRSRRCRLLCGGCRRVVTDDGARIERSGRHQHVFANPHGIAFEIGCFAEAPGCLPVGPRESQFSWFPGYTWQLSICRSCHGHLGWCFQAGGSRFHGLILDRLITEERDG